MRLQPHGNCQPLARGGSRGFTLIEMMVVVLLIGILTVLIIPEMKGSFEDTLLRSTSRDLLNAFALASSRAVSLDQDCRVQLDVKAGRYVVERRVVLGGQEGFVPLKDVDGSEGRLDPRIAIEIREADAPDGADGGGIAGNTGGTGAAAMSAAAMGPDSIVFHADGTADDAEIQLRDPSGHWLRLRMNPVTSRVRVIEPQDQPE